MSLQALFAPIWPVQAASKTALRRSLNNVRERGGIVLSVDSRHDIIISHGIGSGRKT